jgi:cellulose synthase (UDP-forming)
VTIRRISTEKAEIEVRRGAVANLRKGDYGQLALANPPADLLIPYVPMFVGKPTTMDQRSFTVDFDAEAQHFPAIAKLMMGDLDLPRRLRDDRQRRRMYVASLFALIRWAIVCPFAAIAAGLSARPQSARIERRRRELAQKTNTVTRPI